MLRMHQSFPCLAASSSQYIVLIIGHDQEGNHTVVSSLCLSRKQCLPGEMYFHLITPLAIGAVALAMLTVSLGRNEYAAFVGLMLAATSQASNPLEWGYPATYLHGPALTSGWAVANCISAYGGAASAVLLMCNTPSVPVTRSTCPVGPCSRASTHASQHRHCVASQN